MTIFLDDFISNSYFLFIMGEMINILIASKNKEAQEYILSALSTQDDFCIAGVENDETNIIIKSEKIKPNILIIDLQPSSIDTVDLAPIIRRKSPETSIIMICDKDDNDYAGKALKAGISGFMLKKTDMNQLIPIVKIVSQSGYFVSASITLRAVNSITFIKQFPGQFMKINRPALSFSPAERGIVTNIAQGFSDWEIARHLNFSMGTIKNCITEIRRKTNLDNRIQIVLYSLFYGLIRAEHIDILKNQ